MNDNALDEYIKTSIGKGFNQDQIFAALIKAGWDKRLVVQAFLTIFGKKINLSALKIGRFDNLIGESIRMYFSHFWLYFSLNVIPFLLISVLYLGFFAVPLFASKLNFNPWLLIGGLIILISATLLIVIIGTWFSGAFIYSLVNNQTPLKLKDSLTQSWPRIYKFWLTNVTADLYIFFASIFLLIPGIYLLVLYLFTPYVFFDEGLDGAAALSKSSYYVKNNWWKISGRLIIFNSLLFIINFASRIGGAGLLKNPIISIIIIIISLVLSAIVTSIYPVYIYLIYKKTKEIKYLTNPAFVN